ncbi:nucleotide-binding universal stress UspA family protein [Streptomyces sp. V3I8]|uniref:universal stress protein n=1 Tax=Streptomyces sp. V3I8 TaxID=3042279 RepID=UPI00278059CB|nr:universal stress protein [Streptomyces sp. V3I8]MDQ1034466.1 nucleotide-binding universal stress UspA family protein [Streptomyces sp. V3I8]
MLRHVTAGVDGSVESLTTAHWAAGEAVRRALPLRLVHAWKWHPRPPASVPGDSSEHAWAQQTLNKVVDSVRTAYPELHVDARLVSDSPVAALLASAVETEMLVLGSRGLSGVAGFIVGSVSQRVVARSVHPVVLVRAGRNPAGEHPAGPDRGSSPQTATIPSRHVVLGLDTRHPCDELIEFAFEAARHQGGALRVIHAFSIPSADGADLHAATGAGAGVLAVQERDLVAALRPWCAKYPGISVTETVSEGRPATALVRASSGAALVVVGRRIRESHLGTHIGPVTHAVLHHVGCPVAVVPHA